MFCRIISLRLVCLWSCLSHAMAGDIQFNRDIRPILSENCFYCHGQDANHRKADLRLDQPDSSLADGLIVPGESESSELIQRIFSTDPDEVMPPPDSNRMLRADQKHLLRQWVDAGGNYDQHWAYVAPVQPEEPEVLDGSWVKNSIDRFVLAKLESLGVSPSAEADRPTLIKRLYADLIGLPPSPEEIRAFVDDKTDLAYERLVDRLLANDHYGERMALPWLDAARYADSNGFQQDGDTWQWIWRDWVVRALNEDLPFDQFTIWQLAGDLLPDPSTDQLIASGFNRNHLLNGEGGAIPEEQRFVILFDRMDTTATTWLGLTMACAQCHDHKYDPITMVDYYSLMDAFNRVPEKGTPQRQSVRIRVADPYIELPTEENKRRIQAFNQRISELEAMVQPALDRAFEKWESQQWNLDDDQLKGSGLPKEAIEILGQTATARSSEDKARASKHLRKHFEEKIVTQRRGEDAIPGLKELEQTKKELAEYMGDQIPRVMVMSDARPRQTHLLNRGQYLEPMEPVSFDTPKFLPQMPEKAPRNRLGLARWLVDPDHPLTARVQVNRIWQHYFGAGIVKTTEDFGLQSEYPVHKDLLDWLAVEFREKDWSMKQLHRLIVTSATYRQSSRMTAWHREKDIENRLYARASRFRMPSMVLRDWALEASGLLMREMGGAPVYPYQPDRVWEALAITKERDFTYPASEGADLFRRSIYTFWRRTVAPTNMFDASDRQACRVRPSLTSTPLHALTTLNDPTWVEAARALASRSMDAGEDVAARIQDAFYRVMCHMPSEQETRHLQRAYERQFDFYRVDPTAARAFLKVGATPSNVTENPGERAALTAVCLGILNLDEALTRQ